MGETAEGETIVIVNSSRVREMVEMGSDATAHPIESRTSLDSMGMNSANPGNSGGVQVAILEDFHAGSIVHANMRELAAESAEHCDGREIIKRLTHERVCCVNCG